MDLTFINLMPLLSAIFVILLGVFVLTRNIKGRLNQIFFLLTISLFVWMLGTFFLFQSNGDAEAIFWDRFVYAGVAFIPTFMHHYSLIFTREKGQRGILYFGYILSFFFLLISRTDYFVAGVYYYEWGLHTQARLWHHIFLVYFSTYVLLMFANYYRYFISTKSTLIREQAKYNLLAFLALVPIGSLAYLPAYNIGIYPFAYISGIPFSIILAYAIIRYRVMNIRLAFTRSVVYLALVLTISTSFILLTSLTAQVFYTGEGANYWIIWISASVIIVSIIDPLKKWFSRITDSLFYKDRIDYQSELRNLTALINEQIDLSDMISNLHLQVNKGIKLKYADIYLRMNHGRSYISLLKHFSDGENFSELHSGDRVRVENELIEYLSMHSGVLVTEELDRLIYDSQSSGLDVSELQPVYDKLVELDIAAVAPMFHGDAVFAFLAVGTKKSGEAFTSEDVNLLEVLTPQLGAAVERSKLYEEVQDFNTKLQQEVNKATSNLQKANDNLKVANENLMQLDEAKSEFMSIASHQLRTPLAGIIGYLSMLVDGDYGKFTDDQSTTINEVYQASQRLVRLVNTFLNVTRIEAGRFSLSFMETDLAQVVRSQVKEMLPTAEKKGLKLIFNEPAEKEIMVEVDEKIREVFLNLIDNAIKYTQEGSVEVSLAKTKEGFHFTCKDSGVGIAPTEAEKLFQKFVRGNKSARVQPDGSGLGLYIVKRIVDGHSGKIWAESEGEGKGTAFNVVLPLKQKVEEVKLDAERVV